LYFQEVVAEDTAASLEPRQKAIGGAFEVIISLWARHGVLDCQPGYYGWKI